MAYTQGNKILASHLNGFIDDFNDVWGVGTGDSGYGQSNIISKPVIGDSITAATTSSLLTRMASAKVHQGSTLTAITAPVTGGSIVPFSALGGNITTLETNRLNNNANYTDTANINMFTETWSSQITNTFTLTFSSADAARYYFNCGGVIRLSFARSGGTNHTKNTEWSSLATACGTIQIGARGTTKIGGSGSTNQLSTTKGYYNLSTSYTRLFRQYEDSSPYTTNNIFIDAKTNGVQGTNGDTGTVITIAIRITDGASDVHSNVDGTWTNTITARTPNTTHLNNASWVGAPVHALTSFTNTTP